MVHAIGPRVSVVQLSLLRSLAGLVIVAILAWRGRGLGWWIVKTEQLPLQVLRGVVSFAYLWVMILSFGNLPFADATAISYTQAAYVAIFSIAILGERVGAMRWAAVAIGFIGALFVIRPAFLGWNAIYLVALFGTSLNGLSFVLNKHLQRAGGDSDVTTMFYVNAVPALLNLPVAATTPLPSIGVLPWLSGVAVFGPLGVYVGIAAVRHAKASALAPYTFLRLVIGVLAGIVVFRELPGLLGLVGAALILTSCVLSAIEKPFAATPWQRLKARSRQVVSTMPMLPRAEPAGGRGAFRGVPEAQASSGD
jgi:drug/metabolite transporter (DMT)-like permease